MSISDQGYMAAHDISPADLPAAVLAFFDGKDLLSKTQAVRLTTTDADGWPRALLLSAGEMLILPDRTVRFAVYGQSGSVANLARDGRLILNIALDGGVFEMRLRATPCRQKVPDGPLAYFKAEILGARRHAVDYADVISGITFALHDPQPVLQRWQQQIAALRIVS
jgi:hypothetical protein